MARPARKATPKKPSGKKDTQHYLKRFWQVFGGFMLFLLLYFFLISMGLLGFMPSFKQLENPDPLLSTEVYSEDGVILGRYFIENRSNIEYNDLPKHLVDALIATEDVRFYKHSGIDGRSLFRVFFRTLLFRQNTGGGSTITQQLAKNLFPRDEDLNAFQLIHRKFKEWVIAVKLEKKYTKEEIIAFYLNTVQFNKQAYGIKSAAEVNFGKTPDKLSVEESAVLVGMLRNPIINNPLKNPENALQGRNRVLGQMAKYEKLPQATADSLERLPLKVKKSLYNARQGMAPYVLEAVKSDLLKWCKNNKKADGTPYDIYADGLKVYTTIDSRMQLFAEEALRTHVKKMQEIFYKEWSKRDIWKGKENLIKKAMKDSELYKELKRQGKSEAEIQKEFEKKILMSVFSWEGPKQMTMSRIDSIKYYKQLLQSGLMAMEAQTGEIKAWVGGIDFNHFQYDHVMNASRQVGSTFKPFVYAFAIENGIVEPCTQVPNTRICLPDDEIGEWCPDNSNKDWDDLMVSVKFALANSLNRVSVYLIDKAGPENIKAYVKNMGINVRNKPVPSLALGVCDATLNDMVAAYGCFPNQGVYNEPHYLLRIEDKNGKVLAKFGYDQHQAINQRTAETMCLMMKGVIDGETNPLTGRRTGTGVAVRSYGYFGDMAGKTGTTQNNSDGWFIGYSPELVCGVWMGCEDPQIHFASTASGQGSKTALPIFGNFMNKVYTAKLPYKTSASFARPDSTWNLVLDCQTVMIDSTQTTDSTAAALPPSAAAPNR